MIAVAVVAVLVVGIVAMLSGNDDGSSEAARTGGNQTSTGASNAASSSSAEQSTSASPGVRATCWNGRTIIRGQDTCPIPVAQLAVLKFAFPVDWSNCVAVAPQPYNGISYQCSLRGAQIHIATYTTPASRLGRLREYGFPGSCQNLSGGRMRCGPTASGRVVRTYEDDRIRLYMSTTSDDAYILDSLSQRPAPAILSGTGG